MDVSKCNTSRHIQYYIRKRLSHANCFSPQGW
jgi:hypothetical protein